MQASDSLTLIESILLGAVQGVTEFLPISSDGHLVLARYVLDYHKDILLFDVLLHLGTLGSLLVVFHKQVRELLVQSFNFALQLLKEKKLSLVANSTGQDRWMIYVWITTGVTGVIGLVFEKKVEELFSSMTAASVGFLITSVFLTFGILRSSGTKKIYELGWWFPFLIGLSQSLALLPGVSRSGCTIATALIFLSAKKEAGEFSFVAAIPIIFLASLYQMRKLFGGNHENLWVVLAGVVTAFFVGIAAVKLLMWMLNKQRLHAFAIYTGLLGIFGLFYFS